MASSAKAIELCDNLTVGINHYIKNIQNQENRGENFEPTSTEYKILLNLLVTFFDGIARETPAEHLLVVNFDLPNQAEANTQVQLDLKNFFISTLIKDGVEGNLDDTSLLMLEEATQLEEINTLARSLIQKFPNLLLNGLVAKVDLVSNK